MTLKKRGKLIKICEAKGFAKPTIYRNLRKYWIRGKTKNALLPDYFNCGNKAISKLSYTKKTGSLKDVVSELGLSKAAIIRNIKRLGITPNWSSSNNVYTGIASEFKSRTIDNTLREKYRELWLSKQSENIDISMTELIENNKGAYKWLSNNDKDWLIENSPEAKETSNNNIVDWNSRDILLCETFKNIVNDELSKEERPIRITKLYLFSKAKLSNKKSIDLDKIPNTKQFLMENCESIEQHHKRRLQWAKEYAFNNGLSLSYSNIFKIASIDDSYFNKYKDSINDLTLSV